MSMRIDQTGHEDRIVRCMDVMRRIAADDPVQRAYGSDQAMIDHDGTVLDWCC